MHDIASPVPSLDGKFRLAGKVAGVDACQLVSDVDEIVVGSAIDCDLVVTDPLVPRRAFRLRRQRDHVEPEQPCDTFWILESYPSARVYVNQDLVRRGRVSLGDTISLGCHQFEFTVADHKARNYESNVEIDDLCDRLVNGGDVPRGFLEGCPSWINRRRMRRAVRWTTALAAVILLFTLLAPRQRKFEQVQPPMEVVVLDDRMSFPDPDAVRSLHRVQRKSVAEPEDPLLRGEIQPDGVKPVKALDAQPLPDQAPETIAKPAAARLDTAATTASPNLPALLVKSDNPPAPSVDHQQVHLEPTAPVRRLTLSEVNDPVFRKELGNVEIKVTRDASKATPINQWSGPITRSLEKPSPVKLESSRADELASLARYKPSPLRFETRKGALIPVARLPEKLTELEVKAASGKSSASPPGVVLDGEVSDAEIALAWKSGRFRVHGPGMPPFADPATYCYVGKTEKNGRQFLYVAFVCMDPHTERIVTAWGDQGKPELNMDDSIEIYLDTTNQRHQYYQMIVNAKGRFWAHIVNNSGGGQYVPGPVWDAEQQIKTTINPKAGRWNCEVLLPFDHVGGVPAKGARWAVNFCRNFRGQTPGHDEQLQCWFLVFDKTRNYHNSELFGVFEW